MADKQDKGVQFAQVWGEISRRGFPARVNGYDRRSRAIKCLQCGQ